MRPAGPPRSRPAPRAQPFERGHGGPGAAARGVAALLPVRPRRHLPQLALHRGLRLHARAGERGAGVAGAERGQAGGRAGADGLPCARRWRRRASCTPPARTAPTWRSASTASRSWRAGSPTTTRCEYRGISRPLPRPGAAAGGDRERLRMAAWELLPPLLFSLSFRLFSGRSTKNTPRPVLFFLFRKNLLT